MDENTNEINIEGNSSNPFSDDMNENISADIQNENDAEEIKDEEEKTDETEEVKEENNTSDNSKENESENKAQKKNIFDGLFSKKNNSEEDLKKLKEECEKINNQYLRLAADFDNYRKRQAAEKESLIKFGMEQALKKMIEVADNFERAEKSLESIDDIEKAKEAFTVLAKQFRDSMTKLGLEPINAKGEMFDPNLHEAVMQTQTEEFPEETVLQELQKGYKYGDKVLRPSMVSVAVK